MKGRHAQGISARLLRDLATMLGGILVVGGLVFGGLWLFSRGSGGNPTTTTTVVAGTIITQSTTTTTLAESTTVATTATTEASTTTAAIRPPSEVGVMVLNSTGTPGLAAQVSQQLAALGYQTFPPGNYSPTQENSWVWYSNGFAPEAFELAAQFPDARVEPYVGPEDTGADIVVVLGQSYAG